MSEKGNKSMTQRTAQDHITTAAACLTLAITTAEEERREASSDHSQADSKALQAARTGDIAAAALMIIEQSLKQHRNETN